MRKILSFIALLAIGFILVACAKTVYQVTFETNGGGTIPQVEVEDGKFLIEPDEPEKPGFNFGGWYKEEALTNEWKFDTDVVTGNIKLYAKWITSDQSLVDTVYDWLSLGDLTGLTNQSARLILPTTREGVTISWSIDKTQYIAANGMITQPAHEVGNQTVTLTATLTKGSATRTKTFTATVLALPSVEDTLALINEDFKLYSDGNILGQEGIWGPVSGKSGTSLFTVVSSLTPAIPGGSKALKIEALTELQIETPIVHTYDLVVIEVDLMQTATSNASAVNIQSSSSSPVIGFGLDGASLFYRVDNGDLMKTPISINQWYTLRVEIDLANKTLEAFYYEDGQLIAITPDKVSYTGVTSLQSLFIRSGSSTTTVLRAPAYVTNLVANRIEALPRPVEEIKLGQVTDVPATVSVEEGATFTPSTPKVYNYYGAKELLTLTSDYTVQITNPVDINTPGDYTVTYTITNVDDVTDVKVVNQTVTVYSVATPNEITAVTSTKALYDVKLSDITVTVVKPEGTLYYLLSDNATETAASIEAAQSVSISSNSVLLDDLNVSNYKYIHVVVEINGTSNVFSHEINRQLVIEIDTPQVFYDAIHLSDTVQKNSYLLLTADLDFAEYTWVVEATKLWTTLDGDGHKISNLSMTRNVKGGIFAEAENAVIKNLVFDNIDVISSIGASAVLVGETKGTVLIENLYFSNSSIEISDTSGGADYAGFVVSRVRGGELTINNVSVVDSTVTNKSEYTGGIIAGNEASTKVHMSDIYMKNFYVKEDSTTGQMVGGLVGRVRDEFVAQRIVGVNVTLDGIKNVGGFIGKSETGTYVLSLTDAYLNGEVITFSPDTTSKGSIAGQAVATPTLSNVWVSGFANAGTGLNADEGFAVNHNDVKNATWWTTNINAIASSNLWAADSENIFALNNYLVHLKPLMTVTLDYNFEVANEEIQIRQDQVFSHTAPNVPGYNFVGWFTDADMTVALPVDYKITAAVTLYGKYEVVPASQVTFVTNVDGLIVPMQEVNYNQLATLPVVADTMIGGVLKEVTGWTLNGSPFAFTTPITANTELVAVWETVSYQVTFNGGDAVSVLYGELVTEPEVDPVHYFSEVTFKEWQVGGVAYNFATPVTSNLALVAAFNDPVSISIDNVEEFNYMASHGSSWNYELSTNLDFTDHTWVDNETSFKGVLDGKGFTISNLAIAKTVKGGIFAQTENATIKNLILDNIDINSSIGSTAILVGDSYGTLLIENLVMMNSSLANNDISGNSDYSAAVIARVRSGAATLNNISIINTTVLNKSEYTGGIIAGHEAGTTVTMNDIYMLNVDVTEESTTGQMVGSIAGRVRGTFTVTRFVGIDVIVSGIKNVGGMIGKTESGTYTITLSDIYLNGEVNTTPTSTTSKGSVVGKADATAIPVQNNVWASGFANAASGTNVGASFIVDHEDVQLASWWTTNMANIVSSEVWGVFDDGTYALDDFMDTLPPLYVVTIDFNTTHDSITQNYREGMLFNQNSPVLLGFNFLGWYSDEALTLSLSSPYVVNSAVTIYAKYEAVPPSQVSFVTNVDGLTVPTQEINFGLLATLPVVANQTIGGILNEVSGWTLNGTPYDFDTPITSSIELVAVWTPVTYTVKFDGKNPVEVLHNELVTEPEVDPVHIFSERTFVEWRLSGVAYDFNTPVTSDLALVSYFSAPTGDVIITTVEQFHTMATVESTYSYKLANDLDFTSYTWTYVDASFKGTFDGQNHTVSNLSIAGTYITGIFSRANGATIKNLVIDNLTISSSDRAGGLIGRVENGNTSIENIVIKNSSITGNNANGVGGVIGLVSKETSVYNVAVIDTSVTNTSTSNVGGLVGRVDSAPLYADDIFISGVTVKSGYAHATTVGAGALVGYIRDNASSLFSGVRVVVWNTTVDADVAGAFIGRLYAPGQADLMDAYFKVTFVNNERSNLVAYNQSKDTVTPAVDTTYIFGSLTNNIPAGANEIALSNVAVPTDAAWWTTNINNIATSDFWVVNSDGSVILALLAD